MNDLQTLFEQFDEVVELLDTLKLQALEEKDQDFYDALGSADSYLFLAMRELKEWRHD